MAPCKDRPLWEQLDMTALIPAGAHRAQAGGMSIIEQPVSYFSDGDRLAGTLYVSDGAASAARPGIVLCHGFTGIKELILPDYAR